MRTGAGLAKGPGVGVEASTGPDLALSHESVRNGVRGLPDPFGRLPELQDLLA